MTVLVAVLGAVLVAFACRRRQATPRVLGCAATRCCGLAALQCRLKCIDSCGPRRRLPSTPHPPTPRRRVSLSEFKGAVYVGVREFYEKDGQLLPGEAFGGWREEEWEG